MSSADEVFGGDWTRDLEYGFAVKLLMMAGGKVFPSVIFSNFSRSLVELLLLRPILIPIGGNTVCVWLDVSGDLLDLLRISLGWSNFSTLWIGLGLLMGILVGVLADDILLGLHGGRD